jgi:hypothetical protein
MMISGPTNATELRHGLACLPIFTFRDGKAEGVALDVSYKCCKALTETQTDEPSWYRTYGWTSMFKGVKHAIISELDKKIE